MKNENLKLILIALGITACICTLISLGNNVIPERLKFDVNIWGTVNSWLVYGLAIVTAVFLYKTLRSQQEVQKTQNELFAIETLRFRESIKPKLTYSASTNRLIPGDENKAILTIDIENESTNVALNIPNVLSQGENSKQIFVPMGFQDKKSHIAKGERPVSYHFLVDKNPSISEWISLEMVYNDISGTSYKQRVKFIYDKFGIEIIPSLPEAKQTVDEPTLLP